MTGGPTPTPSSPTAAEVPSSVASTLVNVNVAKEDGPSSIEPATTTTTTTTSDSDAGNFYLVRSKVKNFLAESFGKGTGKKRRKRKQRARPEIKTILTHSVTAPPNALTLPSAGRGGGGKKSSRELEAVSKQARAMSVSSIDMDPTGMGERQSVISGCSSNTSSFSLQEDPSAYGEPADVAEDGLTLSERQKEKVFNIANEIMTSEQAFVNVLRLLNVSFREMVERMGGPKVIPDEDLDRIFSNLMELQILNADFLKDFIGRVENWSEHPKIADVIVRKGPFLKLYTSYVHDFPLSSQHFIECCEKYPAFSRVVKDFEAREDLCKGLKVDITWEKTLFCYDKIIFISF